MRSDINKYRPYKTWHDGQAEAVTEILRLWEDGTKIIELNGPTACGKSAILFTLGRILTEEYGLPKVVYSSPLISLVNQLQDTPEFSAMPTLKGKSNYPCQFLNREMETDVYFCDECPFQNFGQAITRSHGRCKSCPYQVDRNAFMDAPFGATTFARFSVDHALRGEVSGLLIDESARLEKPLLEMAALKIPDKIDLNDLHNSIRVYSHELDKEASDLERQITEHFASGSTNYKAIAELRKKKQRVEREASKAAKMLSHMDHDDKFVIDEDRKFRVLDGHGEFLSLISGLDIVVLASGTPATEILTRDFKTVTIQHPIPLSQRLVHVFPVGFMNYNDRHRTAPLMVEAIQKLHNKYNKHTIVHTGAYNIAEMLYNNFPRSSRKNIVLQDRDNRDGSKNRWMNSKGGIFLSVEYVEGIDLKGPEYPMNIIAKVQFENFTEAFVKARDEADKAIYHSAYRYNKYAAIALMQACGRCTRSKEDFSETWVLDSSFQGFHARNRKMFPSWLEAAIVNEKAII